MPSPKESTEAAYKAHACVHGIQTALRKTIISCACGVAVQSGRMLCMMVDVGFVDAWRDKLTSSTELFDHRESAVVVGGLGRRYIPYS